MQPISGMLSSIQVGQPITRDASSDNVKPWTTSIFKKSVTGPVQLKRTNLSGDAQADLRVHGGPDKAVCVYSVAHYAYWRDALGVADLAFGAFGENFTIDNLDESGVCIGDSFRIGDVVVQVSQPRQPCWKLARRWQIKDLALQVQQTGFTGWYFRVLQEGTLEAGLTIQLENRPHPEWTVMQANQVMHHDKSNRSSAAALARVPELSESWRKTLNTRETQADASSDQQWMYSE